MCFAGVLIGSREWRSGLVSAESEGAPSDGLGARADSHAVTNLKEPSSKVFILGIPIDPTTTTH